jgi:hypothetical protein
MAAEKPLTIKCAGHGTGIAAVVCGHMVQPTDRVLGFVENSSDPNDLQAWCDECEQFFLREQEMTEAFRRFNGMKVICHFCYAQLKDRHTKPEGML